MKNRKSIRALYVAMEDKFDEKLINLNSYKEINNKIITKAMLLEKYFNEDSYKLFFDSIN